MKFDKELLLRLLGEFTAAAMILCLLPMACIQTIAFPNDLLKTSIGCGLTIGVAYQIFNCVSGAHINPLVSVASCILGLTPILMMGLYILCQLLGSVVGYMLFMAIVPGDVFSEKGFLSIPHPLIGDGQALGIEFIATSTFILFWCSVWDKRNESLQDGVSLKVAHLVTLLVLISGYYTGGSFNPFRTLIPAMIHNTYTKIWIYFLAQPIATVGMAFAWKYLYGSGSKGGKGGGGDAE